MKEWVTREEMGRAWIKFSWDRPARVTELALYDRQNRLDNVLSGTLNFDDGTLIAVPALPPGGTPWRITIPPKVVHWLMFRMRSEVLFALSTHHRDFDSSGGWPSCAILRDSAARTSSKALFILATRWKRSRMCSAWNISGG